MSNVAFHNLLVALLVKIYKPIYAWCLANLASKTELSELETLIPVDVNSLTPSSTFAKNSVIGINGVLYRSLRQTSHSPVVMAVQDGGRVTVALSHFSTTWALVRIRPSAERTMPVPQKKPDLPST